MVTTENAEIDAIRIAILGHLIHNEILIGQVDYENYNEDIVGHCISLVYLVDNVD